MQGLKEKALASYAASALKKEDDEKNLTAAEAIRFVLNRFGIEVTVSSDVFAIEGMLFSAEVSYSAVNRLSVIGVKAYRQCSKCEKAIELDCGTYTKTRGEPVFDGLSIQQFGQWLAARHDACRYQIAVDFALDQTGRVNADNSSMLKI